MTLYLHDTQETVTITLTYEHDEDLLPQLEKTYQDGQSITAAEYAQLVDRWCSEVEYHNAGHRTATLGKYRGWYRLSFTEVAALQEYATPAIVAHMIGEDQRYEYRLDDPTYECYRDAGIEWWAFGQCVQERFSDMCPDYMSYADFYEHFWPEVADYDFERIDFEPFAEVCWELAEKARQSYEEDGYYKD